MAQEAGTRVIRVELQANSRYEAKAAESAFREFGATYVRVSPYGGDAWWFIEGFFRLSNEEVR